MMRSVSFLLFCFLLFVSNISNAAAVPGTVEGVVRDKSSNDIIPYATVALFHASKMSLFTGSVSDEKGKFVIKNVAPGEYYAVVSFIGFKNDTIKNITISEKKSSVNLGTLKIQQLNTSLSEVTVAGNAATSATKIDRQTFRATDFETAKGGNAVDLMSKLPSVSVSPDGDVSVRGTTGFIVYLNGKPTQFEPSVLLAQIPANSIENIEIITSPGAKYDAQGKAGIINITTKRAALDGTSIVSDALFGGSPWNEHIDPLRYGGSVNVLHQKDNISMYAGGSYNRTNVRGHRDGDAHILQNDGTYFNMIAAGNRPEWKKNASAQAGIEIKLENNSTVSAGYFFGRRLEGRTAEYLYHNFYSVNATDLTPITGKDRYVFNPNTQDRLGVFHTANVDFSKKYTSGDNLSISVVYEHSNLSSDLDNKNIFYNPLTQLRENLEAHFKQTDENPLNGYRISIDYKHILNKNNSLEFGVQPQFIKQSGSFNYDTLGIADNKWYSNTPYVNKINLDRSIYAGYLSYAGKFDKLSIIAGLRGEIMRQNLELDNPNFQTILNRPAQKTFEVNQVDWFPTVATSYTLNENNKVNLSYTKRINRPPSKNMAPFQYRRHFEVYEVGDPSLKPEYINAAELSYNKKVGKSDVSVIAFYRSTENIIFRVNTINQAEQVLIRSYTNSGNDNSTGVELNSNINLGSKAKMYIGGSVYKYNVKGNIFGYNVDEGSLNWSLKGNLNVNITKEVKFTVDGTFQSGTVTAQGSNDYFFISNALLNYSPAKYKAWSFNMKVIDIFDTNIQGLNTKAKNAAGQVIFWQETTYFRPGPILELSLSYVLNKPTKAIKKGSSAFGDKEF